uniref:Uncharacterized protein n=1 Tax=Romanomermis culicivorax TaxID=13658 RepID=A0A915HGW8_ROMCU
MEEKQTCIKQKRSKEQINKNNEKPGIYNSRRTEIVEESRRSKKRGVNVVGQSRKSDNRQESKK